MKSSVHDRIKRQKLVDRVQQAVQTCAGERRDGHRAGQKPWREESHRFTVAPCELADIRAIPRPEGARYPSESSPCPRLWISNGALRCAHRSCAGIRCAHTPATLREIWWCLRGRRGEPVRGTRV